MSESPSTNGANGRGAGGRFLPGNAGGPGNPFAKQVAALRAALLNAVTPDDMAAIAARLIADAKAGNVPAAREIIERAIGKTLEWDLLARIEALENRLADGGNDEAAH